MKHTILVPAFVLLATLSALAEQSKHNEETVAQLQAEMASGKLNSVSLTNFYINRILTLDQKGSGDNQNGSGDNQNGSGNNQNGSGNDQNGPGVNSVIELNPDALSMARNADNLRRQGIVLGPLHGIPVLLKDNIGTGDKMQTAAGSLALVGQPATEDSTVAAKLRAGGAVILGKTNPPEWANFRSFFSTSGWSGRGGLTNNPYSLDRNACGSSSGSAAAVSANFSAVSFGSETD